MIKEYIIDGETFQHVTYNDGTTRLFNDEGIGSIVDIDNELEHVVFKTSDYCKQGYVEDDTTYLSKSPRNLKRLQDSINGGE